MSLNRLLVMAVAATVVAAPAQAANLIVNGSFEANGGGGVQLLNGSNALGPWVVDGPSGELYWQPNGTNGTVSQDGVYNLDLTGICDNGDRCPAGLFGGVSQTIPTVTGERYHLSFWGGNWIPQGAPSGIRASAGDASIDFLIPTATTTFTEWNHFGLDFTALSDSTVVAFVGTAGHTLIGLDNVSVESVVPEPATWAAMIFGLGLAGGALRRRQVRLA